MIERARSPRIGDTETSKGHPDAPSLRAAQIALDAVAFTTQPGRSADIAGFVTAHPQIPQPGNGPRYLLFGPAVIHALCGTSSQSIIPDPYLRLAHTGNASGLHGVTLTWSGTHNASTLHSPTPVTVQLREPAAKLNAHARLAVVDSLGAKTIILVPHPATLLVLAASDLFNDSDHAPGTCRALLHLLLERPTTEDPRQWNKLISDTANGFETPALRDSALARISSTIDYICCETGNKRSADMLSNLLS